MYAEEFEVIDCLHGGQVDKDGGVSSWDPPEFHNQLLCFANVEGEVEVVLDNSSRYLLLFI